MWKGCAFAFAARNGVFAALLAADGMTGPAPLFEGEMGFFQQVSGPFDLPKLGGPTADDWMLPKTSIKFVPAEYHSQSAIAAAFELRPQIGDPARIRSIEIATFRMAVEIIGQGPREVAAEDPRDGRPQPALLHGRRAGRRRRSRPSSSRPSGSPTPPCSTSSRAPRVVEDPQLTAGYPAGIPNRVTVTLDDGTHAGLGGRLPPRPRQEPAHRRPARRRSSTGWSTRSWAASGPIGSGSRVAGLEDDPAPHETLDLLAG